MLPNPGTNGGADRMPYHEFYLDDFAPREHYRPLWEHIRNTGQSALGSKVHEADLALRSEGVTFTVYSDSQEGIERVWPFDLIPRIIPANEWAPIESGLKQRVRALICFSTTSTTSSAASRTGCCPAISFSRAATIN